jgi:putative flippase GtrA
VRAVDAGWRWASGAGRELAWFAAVGAASTAVQSVLYLLVRPGSGPAAASAVALLVSTVLNTEAHRHLTFRAAAAPAARAHLQAGSTALAVHLVHLGLLAHVAALRLGDHPVAELAVLAGLGIATGLLRFTLLRQWAFRSRDGAAAWRPAVARPARPMTGCTR